MTSLTERQQFQEDSYVFPYHYLDLVEDKYKYILHLEYLSYMKLVKELLRPYTGQSVLDVGCGDGRFCYEMRGENVKMTGMDYSQQAVSFARVFNPEMEFLVRDLRALELPCRYDRMVLIETLEHFVPDEIPLILKNLAAFLKDDGKIILTVPSPLMVLGEKHYQHFTVQSLRQTLVPSFTIDRVMGHNNKKSPYQRILSVYKIIAHLALPFRNQAGVIRKFYAHMGALFTKHLELCGTDDADRLIAVCSKGK